MPRTRERPRARPPAVVSEPPAKAAELGLYSAEEALSDAVSGPLEYIGTGRWPGVERSRACAFRNRRVVLVNAYCTLNETPAFRIDIFSPERGRVRIYAEAHGAVSARERRDYYTFMVESSPPPSSDARLPPMTLAMGYDALRSYEQQRYEAYLPSCYGGTQHGRRVGGCLGSLELRTNDWAEQHHAFLERANDDWYRLIRELRTLAGRYGAAQEN